MRTKYMKVLAVAVTASIVVGACGGDDDAAAPAVSDEATEESVSDEATEESAPEPTEATDAPEETTAAEETVAPEPDSEPGDAFSPQSPECVAPADAGGGWDFTCRSIGQLLQDVAGTSNVVVTNLPGGGGGVAFADIAANRSDSDDLVIAASPATAIRFAQNQYSGLQASDFRWVGAIGADFGVVSVGVDSEFETFEQLAAAMQEDPTSVIWGGGSPVGGQDHFKVLLLAQELGIDPAAVPWVAYDGGGEAQNALLGGEIQVFPGDVSETLGNENLRILTVLAPERVPAMPDIPTTVELGYETIFPIWRGLAAPGGMSDEAYAYWVDALGRVEASDEWTAARDENGLSPLRLLGDDFNTFVLGNVDDFRTLSEPFGLVAS